MQAINVRVGVTTVEDAEAMLVAAQTTSAWHITREEDRHCQLQVAEQLILQRVQLHDAFQGERPTGSQ
ncbi:hypothetical protein D3C77_771280 [compost metagenome]